MNLSISLVALAVILLAVTASAQTTPQPPTGYAIAPGPFEPTYESFAKNYQCPEWFRDAKLGIWAHWGPQAVPMEGDWYARQMYIQGHRQYEDHLKRYGHPTKTGYKDIIPLWKAEKWDPDRLMAMYKKAGAKYFVSMGCHHDNFDLWNSKWHRWNAVNMGPHKDVVGTWQKAAKRLGLRFGVSEHMGASFTWFQTSHGSDKTGPLAGVSYDGADPQYEDLYHQQALPGDTGWYSNDPRWHQEWFNRVKDLIDNYNLDLLYTDGGVPFGNEVGRSMIAHLYNTSAAHHGGKEQVVYNCKQASEGRWVEDLERGVMPRVNPHPWQTDTSIGDWFYNRNWKFRGADWVIHMLVDIVSKNGNLLLNVVQRPDGSLDPEAEQILAEMADWIAVNGEGIYKTRPWTVYGEGPTKAQGGNFKEDFGYSASDIRFTTKGDKTLYAFALGWPDNGKLTIRSLAKVAGATGTVKSVRLLGHEGTLGWHDTADGLTVDLPARQPSKYAIALKITVDDLGGFKPELAVPSAPAITAESDGSFLLRADSAELHGSLQTEQKGGEPNIGFWDNAADWASWKIKVAAPGVYRVTASCATIHETSPFVVDAAGAKIEGAAANTGGWDRFSTIDLGTIHVEKTGEETVAIHPKDAQSWKAINLRWVKLTPATQ